MTRLHDAKLPKMPSVKVQKLLAHARTAMTRSGIDHVMTPFAQFVYDQNNCHFGNGELKARHLKGGSFVVLVV
jgi:hypothetical protein